MYGKLLKYYLEQQRWTRLSADEIRDRQTLKFRRLFKFARMHSPFYRKVYNEAGVENLEIRTFEDIQKVPVVDKAMMRAHSTEEIMTHPITPDLVLTTTSGSTGEPFKVYQSKYEQYTSHLRILWMLTALGYRPWHQILMLWRLDPSSVLPIERDLSLLTRLRKAFKVFRRDILSIYADPEEVISWIQARPNAYVLLTTPAVLNILCEQMEIFGISFKLKLTILLAEPLPPEQRDRFARFMGGRVVSHYGLMECPTIAFDSGLNENKRIFANAFMTELLNIKEKDNVPHGDLVITNLVNWTMPFIRYNTHDTTAIIDDLDCPSKIIGPIHGRVSDVLELPHGGKLARHQANSLFTDFDECYQFKFVQTSSGEIVLRLKKRSGIDESLIREKALDRWNKRYAGEPLKIEFVETLPIDPKTGKFKLLERL